MYKKLLLEKGISMLFFGGEKSGLLQPSAWLSCIARRGQGFEK
jgi:hypothetical protein